MAERGMGDRAERWKSQYSAPSGQVWVCAICGRHGANRVDIGDESCFLNAVLCYDSPTQEWHDVDTNPPERRKGAGMSFKA